MRAESQPSNTEAQSLSTGSGRPGRFAWIRWAPRILSSVAFVAYPMVAYATLRWWSPREALLAMLAVFLPALWLRHRGGGRSPGGAMAWVPGITVVLLGVGALFGEAGLALWTPVAINGALFLTFATTLRRGPPLVERFARLTVPDLEPAELRWCWGWTVAWAAFFVVNGSVAAGLAAWGPLTWWTLYTGLLGYIAVGIMFGVEYTVRKYRFGRLGDHPLDRALARLFRSKAQEKGPSV